MAFNAVQEIQKTQTDILRQEHDGRLSNQFCDELKQSQLFQFSWGELLAAAPTALSLMGSLWIAASDPKADKISMKKSMPTKGFSHIPNRENPTLRSCLSDVCDIGGRKAFTVAGANMDALTITSSRITNQRIDLIFKLLGPCTTNQEALEDFNDALKAFSKDASTCSRLAKEIRMAFTKWGDMVGELKACTEAESGHTSIQKEATRIDEESAKIQEKFAVQTVEQVKGQVERADKALKKAEQRLDQAIDKVPGPLMTAVTGAIAGFTQALPHVVAGVLPAVLAASNPVMGVGMALGQAGRQGAIGAQSDVPGHVSGAAPGAGTVGVQGNAPTVPSVNGDPAYQVAVAIRELVNLFYSALGGDSGPLDWSKFDQPEDSEDAKKGIPQGVAYFRGNFQAQQDSLDITGTEVNNKLVAVFETLKKVNEEIAVFLQSKNDIGEAALDEAKLKAWKKDTKKVRGDVLAMTTAANTGSSSSVPNPYANVKINVPKVDTSAQTAQLSTAMQGVQIAQSTADAKQEAYDAAIAKQEKTQAAMALVQEKLKRLQEQGKTLDEIKQVLSICINVLVDLTVQIAKLESFFQMLETVIEHIIMVRVEDFTIAMSKAGRRVLANGMIQLDDIKKNTIYALTLSLKGYFMVLEDISSMYAKVHHGYIKEGMDLCSKLGKSASTGRSIAVEQDELQSYTERSSTAVKELVDAKQEEIKAGLRDRVAKAAKTTAMIENTVQKHGLLVDQEEKKQIQAGADQAKDDARAQIEADTSETVNNSEEVDASAF